MYYVNQEQIHARLQFVPTITEAMRTLDRGSGNDGLLYYFAQERALHLAIEVITDVGSLLIDGFLMRDASSYEDIVDILRVEGVFSGELAAAYGSLIGERRSLTQHYMELDRSNPRTDLAAIADALEQFPGAVEAFMKKELSGLA